MRYFEIGDRVTLSPLTIIERRDELFICQFKDTFYAIPIYIGALNIHFLENSYVMPGGGVDKGHPDYYKYIRRNGSKAIYSRDFVEFDEGVAIEYTIDLDDDFHKNGKYIVTDLTNNEEIIKFAKKIDEQEWNDTINAWVTADINSGTINSTIVRMYIREYEGFERDLTRVAVDVVYLFNTEEAYFYSASEEEIFVVLHDEGGEIEYTLPLNLIKKL